MAGIVVRSTHPAAVVRDFAGADVQVDQPPPEATLAMHGPTDVDVEASAKAYRALHAGWTSHLEREAARLAALEPVALVADVPYLSLAAAQRIGVPAIALCSLNWADIYRAYCGGRPEASEVLAKIEEVYRAAEIFLQPRPHLPMAAFPNRLSIGPIARIGRNRQGELREALGIPGDRRIVLASFGGIPAKRKLSLPDLAGVHWLFGSTVEAPAGRSSPVERLEIPFIDVLASSDVVVTKVGYCTFVEAACNGVGIVSGPRDDWPESGPAKEWASRNARFAVAEPGIEDPAALEAALSTVLEAPRMAPPSATGAAEAVEAIARLVRLPS